MGTEIINKVLLYIYEKEYICSLTQIALNSILMKRITLLFITMLYLSNIALCQINNDEYFILAEQVSDGEGNLITIPEDSIEYHRITNKTYSTWGYKNKKGEIVIPPGKYNFLNPIDKYGMILAELNGKEGYIDITEKILIPFIYDAVGSFSKKTELASVTKNGKQGFINRKGEIVIPLEYDSKSYSAYFHSGVAILTKNKKYGVIDPHNNTILPFEYEKIKYSDDNTYLIVTKEKDWATYSLEGKQLSEFDNLIIIPRELNIASSEEADLPLLITTNKADTYISKAEYREDAKQNKNTNAEYVERKFAYIDKEKKIIVPPGTYDYAEPFGLGQKAIVAKQGAFGIIDKHGTSALPLEFDFIECPSDYAKIFLATKAQRVTIYNKDTKIIPIENITSYNCDNRYIIISDIHGKKGLLNRSGVQTVPFEYDTLYIPRVNSTITCIVKKGDRYGGISENNEIIKPLIYENIYELQNDLVFVDTNHKAGMYDANGNIKLAFEYDSICDTFYNNFESEEAKYIVIKNGKVGTVDIHNKIVIPIIYDSLSGWVEYGPNAHFASLNGKYGLISIEGQIIIPLEYEYVDLPISDVIVVRKNGKYGVLSGKNTEILPCKFDMIINDMPLEDMEEERKGKLVVLLDNKWSYYDKEGSIISKNVSTNKIIKKYGNILEMGEPSNENINFSMKKASK